MGLPALIAASVLVVTVAGCAAGSDRAGPGGPSPVPPTGPGSVPPTGGVSGPPPLTSGSPPARPPLTPVGPVAGSRARAVPWIPADRDADGRLLTFDVQVGGPPCDAITAVDVTETAGSVTVTVHAGVVAGATCADGLPGILGTFRVAARLAAPLGARTLVDGAKR
jgi:hypothetical protein